MQRGPDTQREDGDVSSTAQTFLLRKTTQDIEQLLESCIHCKSTKSGERVLRPLGSALHGGKTNKAVHFDYCYMGQGKNGHKCMLITKDHLSSATWLYACKHADAETTVEAFIDWFGAFRACWQWASAQGSHFKNELMTNLQKMLKCARPLHLSILVLVQRDCGDPVQRTETDN